ncbi:MAG TPA: GatB/YqeY domain-containing protein [Candidatus Saccharimonadales bacterium]|nr:GatB/YqeY domain-containing protein [Candidatus Saccharimonadales bacterium]
MHLKEKINQDLKTAMLSGDKDKVSVLRGLKSAILNEEVAKGAREDGLPDDEVQRILSKEAKKRQESADLFAQGGNQEKADAELAEKQIIEQYLPAQLGEADVSKLIDGIVAENGPVTKETMGATIAAVKAQSGGAADGALTARLVKERIAQETNG